MAKTATGTTTRPCGIIEFGSDDEAVLLQDALTSTPSNGASVGTGVTFGADGMDTNGTGGWRFDLSALGYRSLEQSGQISITVKSQFISVIEGTATQGATGRTAATYNEYILSWGKATSGNSNTFLGRLMIAVGQYMFCRIQNSQSGQINGICQSFNKAEDSVLTLSWHGKNFMIFIDGAPFHYSSALTDPLSAELFKYLWVGTYNENVDATSITSAGWPFKNLIVSNRPVMLPVHPVLRKIAVIGDSHAVMWGNNYTSGESQPRYQFQAYLAMKGIGTGLRDSTVSASSANGIKLFGVNGSVIDNTGTAAAPISNQVAAVVAANPSVVIIHGGTNDGLKSTSFSGTVFDTAYKSILTSLATIPNLERVVVWTVPSLRGIAATYDAQRIAQTAAMNAVIEALPAWWDVQFQAQAGNLLVADLFTAFGGETLTADQYIAGTCNPIYDVDATHRYGADVHTSTSGQALTGQTIARLVYESL